MFALPLLEGDSEIRLTSPLESSPYVDMTLDTIAKYGIHMKTVSGNCWYINGSQKYSVVDVEVERDWSQAAVFFCANALGCDVEVSGMKLDSVQGDKRILEFLEMLGSEIDVRDTPDIVPPLTVTACFADGVTRIVNAGRLRLKESDRLAALTEELGKIGANIRIEGDSLVIKGSGGGLIRGGGVDSHNDHRIAMALALASIKCKIPVVLYGEECVNKSYPDFWKDFEGEIK
jgi:3-phosphoshikimate 1-carboxyvinyltransferase